MKTIAIVNAEATIGGIESALINMLSLIDYSHYKITLFTNIRNNPLALKLPSGIREQVKLIDVNEFSTRNLAKLYTKKCWFAKTIKLILAYLKARKVKTETIRLELVSNGFPISDEIYDCVIAYKMGYWSTCMALNQLHGKIKLYWAHGYLTNGPDYDPTYLNWVRAFDHIFCVSDAVVAQTVRDIQGIENKTSTFLNIMDAQDIREKAAQTNGVVENEMPNDGKMQLLSIGRFTDEKNFTSVPYICQKLREFGQRFHWYIIGYGREEELIRNEIIKNNVEDCCTILGKKKTHTHTLRIVTYISSRVDLKAAALLWLRHKFLENL